MSAGDRGADADSGLQMQTFYKMPNELLQVDAEILQRRPGLPIHAQYLLFAVKQETLPCVNRLRIQRFLGLGLCHLCFGILFQAV